jgi:hypothetical protein
MMSRLSFLHLVPGPAPVRRRRAFAAAALLVALGVLLVGPRPAHSAANRDLGNTAPLTSRSAVTRRAWPRTVTLLTDSVALGAADAIRAALPHWNVEVLGKPALMVKQAVPRYLPRRHHVGSVAVVGLGYNSLWQNGRAHYAAWAEQFDREADRLVADLRERGAKRIVWITLREPSQQVVTADGQYQYDHYAWFFPYVNERLHALAHRHPDVRLADWAAVSDRPGLTYDLIHLDTDGARLMARVVARQVKAP